jgi:hypothetical protein
MYHLVALLVTTKGEEKDQNHIWTFLSVDPEWHVPFFPRKMHTAKISHVLPNFKDAKG